MGRNGQSGGMHGDSSSDTNKDDNPVEITVTEDLDSNIGKGTGGGFGGYPGKGIYWDTYQHQRIVASGKSTETGCTPMTLGNSLGGL